MLVTGKSVSYQKEYFLLLEKIEPSSIQNNVSKQKEKWLNSFPVLTQEFMTDE